MRADEDFLLALLNTTPTVGADVIDALREDEDARGWLAANAPDGVPAEPVQARAVRQAVQSVVRGTTPSESLTPFLAGVRSAPVVTADGLHWDTELPESGALAAHVVLTWGELERERPGRLRPCANDECSRFLIDRSKANAAQWCSMSVCGNRMKARRHYERTRGDGE